MFKGWAYWGIFIAFSLMFIALGALIILPTDSVKSFIDYFGQHSRTEAFTLDWIHSLKTRSYGYAIGSALILLGLSIKRRKFNSYLEKLKSHRKQSRIGLINFIKRSYRDLSTFEKLLIFGVFVLCILFRLGQMNLALTYDEAFTYNQYASRNIPLLLTKYNYPNNQIFHTLLAHLSTKTLGNYEWSLRLPAFIFGCLTPLIGYLLISYWKNKRVALYSIILLSFSFVMIDYSTLARGYSMIWVFTLVSFGAILHFVRTKNEWSLLLAAITISLGMFTIPVMLYSGLLIGGYLLVYSFKNKEFKPIVLFTSISIALTLIFYAPVIINFGINQLTYHPGMGEISFSRLFSYEIPHGLRVINFYFFLNKSVWAIALLILFIFGIIKDRESRKIILIFILSLIPVILLQRIVAPARVWIYTLLFIYPIVSVGFDSIVKSNYKIPSLLLVIILSINVGYNLQTDSVMSNMRFEDDKQCIEFIKDKNFENKILVSFPAESALRYYWNNAGLKKDLFLALPNEGETFIMYIRWANEHTREYLFDQYKIDIDSYKVKQLWNNTEGELVLVSPN